MNQENKPQEIDLDQAPAKIAEAINAQIMAGVPIPFIISALALIQHDLSAKHIERTNAMHKLSLAANKPESVSVADNSGN